MMRRHELAAAYKVYLALHEVIVWLGKNGTCRLADAQSNPLIRVILANRWIEIDIVISNLYMGWGTLDVDANDFVGGLWLELNNDIMRDWRLFVVVIKDRIEPVDEVIDPEKSVASSKKSTPERKQANKEVVPWYCSNGNTTYVS